MTHSTVGVKYQVNDLLRTSHCRNSVAQRRKLKRLCMYGYSREKAHEQIHNHFPQAYLSNSLPSSGMKTEDIYLPSTVSNLSKLDDNEIFKYYKMGGARRKRYRWLITHNYSIEDAIIRSAYPIDRSVEYSEKRFKEKLYDVDKVGNVANSVLHINENEDTAGLINPFELAKDKEIYILIGIFPAAFPKVRFQKQHFEALQFCLSEFIIKDTSFMPQFRGTVNRNGWLEITCANMTTVEWVKEITPFMKPWEGAHLMIYEEKDFPKAMNLICFLPKSSLISNECILEYFRKQNSKNLDINSWKILYREDSYDITKAIISIDDASAFLLKKDGTKLYYMLNYVNFRLISLQRHEFENGLNFTNDDCGSVKLGGRNIGGPSHNNSESSSCPKNYEASDAALRFKGSSKKPKLKLNECNVPIMYDRFGRNSKFYTSYQNNGSFTSCSPPGNVNKEINLPQHQLLRDNKHIPLEQERNCYITSPRRLLKQYDDDKIRGKEGNRRGSNSLKSILKKY